MYREQCSSVWTKLAWVSGLPKGLGERGFYTGEWGGGEEKGSWMLRSALIFGGNTGWNSIVRYVAWCMHWLKRRSISCVTDSWSLGGKLAETLLTPSWHTGKHVTEFPPLVWLCSEFPSSIRKDSFLEERLWEQFRGLHLAVAFSPHCSWFTLHRDLM